MNKGPDGQGVETERERTVSYFSGLLTQKAYSLFIPNKHFEEAHRYVRAHVKGPVDADTVPFSRRLDFWAFSVATALAQGLPPLEGSSSKWGRKFIDTRQVQVPERLCDLLAIAAFHHSEPEDPEIQNPRQIIAISNGLAGAGCPIVLERLNSPELRLTPLAKALDFAASMLNEPPTPATEA